MNVERIYSIALSIKEETDSNQVVQLLSQSSTNLQNMINQPQHPPHQQQLADAREKLKDNLSFAESNEYSPAWNQAIKELGIHEYVGNQLSKKIDTIFLNNQITPQVALSEIQSLRTEVTQMQTALEQIINGLKHIKIEPEILEPGEGELGILLPRSYIENTFEGLSNEFKEINSILRTFSEVSKGEIEHFELKSLSTTDPFILLSASIGVLSTLAVAIEPIISTYKEILEVRLLHSKLAEKKIAKKRLKGIEDHAEELMGKTIEKIKADLLKDYPVQDNGRKNELSNALGPALKMLANRIDRGFNIEIRVEPFSENNEEEPQQEDQKNIEIIQSAMKEMEFMKLEGEPILHLPENNKKG
ncbi:hypothetical protein [Desulfobacula phenolica]|uniref:Uncharacterized protein n=1 Tax=Desulfobacula phenolica TaxID=90732 RepID=A0A1H2KBN7_9BACT|nr:hypothetical protein [Desulfobacula phenolica]SDU66003.1 hypothetical protein SAMN04487931_1293 [Desulfobacula phenolica]